ncbi:MAG: hypothetical protein RLZZ272_1787, partial [Actinomycetota bacterium]
MPSRSEVPVTGSSGAPDELETRLRAARAALDERRLPEAVELFGDALELRPDHRGALVGLAWARRGLGDHAGALEAFRRALETAPDDLRLIRNVVREARRVGRPAEALRLADRGRELAPEDPRFAVERASVLDALDPDLARAAWSEAEELAPDDPEVAIGIARAAGHEQRLEDAAEVLRRAVRARPDERRLLVGLARAELELGHGTLALEALDALERLTHQDSGADGAHRVTDLRIRAHLRLGEPHRARDALEASVRALSGEEHRDPRRRAWESTWRGEIAAASWDVVVAQDHLEQALAADPTLPRAKRLAQVRLAALDPEGARAAWRVGMQLAEERTRGRAPDVPWRVSSGLVGDLINEYLLEPDLTAEARAAVLSDDVEAAQAIVRRAPGSQAAATGLLVVLRRLGGFDAVGASADVAPCESAIPRRIHQAWLGSPVPEDVQRLVALWRERHDVWEHALFDDGAARRLIAQRGRPNEAEAFAVAANATWRADVLRLILLDEYGGFWVDADDLPLASLEQLRHGADLVLPQEPFGAVGNHLIGSTPGHPVVRAALDEVIRNLLSRPRESPWLAVGPGPLTRALAQRLAGRGTTAASEARFGTTIAERIRVLDEHECGRIVSGFRRLDYKSTPQWWRNAAADVGPVVVPGRRDGGGRPRDLLCMPAAGLGDALRDISACLRYARRYGRRLVLHTTRVRLPLSFSECFEVRDAERSDVPIILGLTDWILPDDVTVLPPSAKASLVSEERVGLGFLTDDREREPATFEFSRDHREEVLVYDRSAVMPRPRIEGRSVEALGRLRLRPWLVAEVRARLDVLPAEYVGIHVRNTDTRSDYAPFLLDLKDQVAGCDVLVCSDDDVVIEEARKLLAASRVHQ